MPETDDKTAPPADDKAAPAKSAPRAAAKKKTLKVSAVMITARSKNDRIVYLYRGDVVGEDITPESVDHLKSLGFVTEDDVAPND